MPVSWRVYGTSGCWALPGSLRERGNISECQKQAGAHNSLKYRPACLYICQLIAAETKSPVFKVKGIWQGSKPASSRPRWRPAVWAERNLNWEVFHIYTEDSLDEGPSVRLDKDALLMRGFEPSTVLSLGETSLRVLVYSLSKFTLLLLTCPNIDPQSIMGTFGCQ